jgi:rhamnogalacturonyl hydrolase YesR
MVSIPYLLIHIRKSTSNINRFIRADFIYMAPPFLAYYVVATNNASVLQASVDQCRLYRQILLANTTSTTHPSTASGLWTHIDGPVNADPGLWSTGNGWAAAGMARVLATVLKAPSKLFKSSLSVAWKNEAINDLTTSIREILDAAMRMPTDGGLLLNYLDDTRWFGETSGSALMASVAYRLSVLAPSLGIDKGSVNNYVQWAESIRSVFGQGHITSNGTATPAVNPLGWEDKAPWTAGSPEGQNFVVMMYAAWRDCVHAGVNGCNAG